MYLLLNLSGVLDRIDNLNRFVTTGGGLGLKLKVGYSLNRENICPSYLYADFRLYYAEQGKLGPGLYPYFGPKGGGNLKPLVAIGWQTSLSGGTKYSYNEVSGTDLNFYKNRNW